MIELEATLEGDASLGAPGLDEAPKWEFKTEFGINKKMQEVIELTIKVANEEIAQNKRKIDKLMYGV